MCVLVCDVCVPDHPPKARRLGLRAPFSIALAYCCCCPPFPAAFRRDVSETALCVYVKVVMVLMDVMCQNLLT